LRRRLRYGTTTKPNVYPLLPLMNDEELSHLANQLRAADEEEQQARKSTWSRRGFIRALTGTAAASATMVALNAGADCAPQNTSGCGGGKNTCLTNICSPTAPNTCAPNECLSQNTCQAQASNTCTKNNICDRNNQCPGTNTCTPKNTCGTGHENTCNPTAGANTCSPTSGHHKCAYGDA
jgi:hypothetical protein